MLLIAASPMGKKGSPLGGEVAYRASGYGSLERAWQAGISHAMIGWSGDPRSILLHAGVLVDYGRADDAVAARLRSLVADPAVDVRENAARLLGLVSNPDAPVQAALAGLLADIDPGVRDAAARALIHVKEAAPGATPPPQVLTLLASPTAADVVLAAELLVKYDASEPVRQALFKSSASRVAPLAIAAAASRLFPDDPRSAALVVNQLRSGEQGAMVGELMAGDAAARNADGTLPPTRRALYANAPIGDLLPELVLYGRHRRVNLEPTLWLIHHTELALPLKLEVLRRSMWGDTKAAALEEVTRLGPAAEPLRRYLDAYVRGPDADPAVRRALKALGPAPSATSSTP